MLSLAARVGAQLRYGGGTKVLVVSGLREVCSGASWRQAFRQRRGESSCGSELSGKSSRWFVGCFLSWQFTVENYLETGTKQTRREIC